VILEAALQAHLVNRTGFPVGVGEYPAGNPIRPVLEINAIPNAEMSGGLGSPNTMEDKVFQIDVVGDSVDQVEKAEDRLVRALTDYLVADVAGVMGPPTIRKNGHSRSDDRVFRRIVIATIKTSE
jgi:hypothetical protein